jgi:magnesium-transporting ATPase (P-type)
MTGPSTAPADPHPTPPWHAQPADAALAALDATMEGLSETEAQRRLAQQGPNALPAVRRRNALLRFLAHFDNLLIYVLLGAAVVTGILGHIADTVVILLVVLINAVIGFIQEGRAERSLEAIRDMIAPSASVRRDGHRTTVDSRQLVPGDLVLLEAGDRVPADLRLLRARNLRIDEAVLTGESVAAEKSVEPVAETAALGDRRPITYSGTIVAAGQGLGLTIATGPSTEIGRISGLMGAVETLETPLLRQMNRFGRLLSASILALGAVLFAIATLLRSYPAHEAFMAMVGLVVAAIPEGLPAVMTITLAIGVQRMAARHSIIRKLPAVETLGSVSVICTDKTGTLTRNEMTVQNVVTADRRYDITGVGYEPRGAIRCGDRDIDAATETSLQSLVRAALLCNDAQLRQTGARWTVNGDPMEGALASLAHKAGSDVERRRAFPRTDEIPFDAQHRFMATLHHDHHGVHFAVIKGAPERLLEMCDRQTSGGGTGPLDRDFWLQQIDALAARGLRVLALAEKEMPGGTQELTFESIGSGATLLGLVGLIDPPREEAIAAVHDCRAAGIAIKMITGDHAITAGAIAVQLNLPDAEEVVTGQQLDQADEAEFRRLAHDGAVFARTTPEHKLRLVAALQAEGAVVAMTGDGVNDAPALKRADVGVAMGQKGTEAAKQAAEMVLADDNFASIVAAVREGRTVYDNLKKVIGWTLPTSGGQSIAILGAVVMGWTLPVTPLQILWVNMITAITLGLTLAFEPTEPGTMRRPPRRPDEPLLSGFLLWRIVFVSALFGLCVFGVFFQALDRGLPVETARTLAVNTIVAMQIFYLFNVRYIHGPSLTWRGVLGTPAVLIAVGVVVIAQLALTYFPPLQTVFATRSLGLREGLAALAAGVALLLVIETEKRIRHAFHRT